MFYKQWRLRLPEKTIAVGWAFLPTITDEMFWLMPNFVSGSLKNLF
ncbi:MAG: hypothetical protein IKX14_07330 [Neisseriaceae bacterium]|nr:hypothetical protein [Neisseriaceae bacterium]